MKYPLGRGSLNPRKGHLKKSAASTNPSNHPKFASFPCYAYYTQPSAGYSHCPIMFYIPTPPSAEKKARGESSAFETAHTSKRAHSLALRHHYDNAPSTLWPSLLGGYTQ